MKTVFKLDDSQLVGILQIHDRSNTYSKVFEFDFETINNWYPLNSEYDLVYQMELNQLQVVPISRGEILYKDYGIKKFDEKIGCSISNGLNNVVIEPVKKDNLAVCDNAKELGLPTWLDKFTYNDVMDSLGFLDSKLDNTTDHLVKEYYKALKQDEKFGFLELTKSTRHYYALKALSPEQTDFYVACGKVYTMLNVMRKVAKLYA